MADICPVCDRSISFITKETIQGINLHHECIGVFLLNPEKYGGKPIEKLEAQIKAEKEHQEQQNKQEEEKALYKSVYIKGGIDVKSFDMPFEGMVMFMVKWAIASIPAFIILFIIYGIFFAVFGALFF